MLSLIKAGNFRIWKLLKLMKERHRDRCVAGERDTVYPPARAGMRILSSAMDSTKTTAPSSRNLAQMCDFEGDFAVGRPLSRSGESPGSSSRSLLQDNHGIVRRIWQSANKSFTSFIVLCVFFCLSPLSCCQCSKFGASKQSTGMVEVEEPQSGKICPL